MLITLGILGLMVVYPVLTSVERITGLGQGGCWSDPDCLSDSLPLLKNQRTGLIDPDTPESAYTKTDKDGKPMKLVFSDEFNLDGRTFWPNDDPYFEAVNIWYGVTMDLEWYDPDAVTTEDGSLVLKFDAFQSHNLNYRSGMVQSWNKLCFKGGRIEASLSLPGSGQISGFWPGFWAMGNLGRPGFAATTEGMWPYSYHDVCDVGITPNQSSTDGISWLPGMKMPACTCDGEDHPSQGNSRSAPEIDALEATVGYLGTGFEKATGTASQSFQAAPFDIWYEPDYNYMEVYDNEQTEMNAYRGGSYQQAISGLSWLNNDWYNGKAYQTYGWEYKPGPSGDITWFIGDQYSWRMDARSVRPNGNVGQRTVPQEPMSIVMNFGMSDSFTTVLLPNLHEYFPAKMRFDYIRIYQEEASESMTCDPPGYPTTTYIKDHPAPYANPNLTSWSDTVYDWPQNSFMNTC